MWQGLGGKFVELLEATVLSFCGSPKVHLISLELIGIFFSFLITSFLALGVSAQLVVCPHL